jgi:hypothetical protein
MSHSTKLLFQATWSNSGQGSLGSLVESPVCSLFKPQSLRLCISNSPVVTSTKTVWMTLRHGGQENWPLPSVAGGVESLCLHWPKNWLVRQRIDSRDDKVGTEVGFIREKGQAALEKDREPGKSVAPCCSHRGVLIWSFLLGRSQGSGWSGLLIYLCRDTLCWGGESGVRSGAVS